jgi:hypothetical protein
MKYVKCLIQDHSNRFAKKLNDDLGICSLCASYRNKNKKEKEK